MATGTCAAHCSSALDCAPGLSSVAANVLFQCLGGLCERRCLNDSTCGTQVCINGGCATSNCKTASDCPAGELCTSTARGRCVPFQTCSASTDCAPGFSCAAFDGGTCPPGFDCSTAVCQELPRCLIDSDCLARGAAYCSGNHCHSTNACSSDSDCDAGTRCIGSLCYPGGCRGPAECPQGACIDGSCQRAADAGEIATLSIAPSSSVLAVGATQRLTVTGFDPLGQSRAINGVQFGVMSTSGGPSSAATVDSLGNVTGVAEADVSIVASLPGSAAAPVTATISIDAPAASGRRVVAIDTLTHQPLSGVVVEACDNPPVNVPCPSPITVTTDARGSATLAFDSAPMDLSAVSSATRSDGLPLYDRVSVLATSATTVVIPLSRNPVAAAAGFRGTMSFDSVQSTGSLLLGMQLASVEDPSSIDLRTLFGDPFLVKLPTTQQQIALPGSTIAELRDPFGEAVPIKATADALAQAGDRVVTSLGGAFDPQTLTTLGATDVLAYAANMQVDFSSEIGVPLLPLGSDAGVQTGPDYALFPSVRGQPSRIQSERTEIQLPSLPAGLDTAIIVRAQSTANAGLVFDGLTSRTGGAPAPDGSRALGTVLIASAPPFGGVESGESALWVHGYASAGAGSAGAIVRAGALPGIVAIPALPSLPTGTSFDTGSRTLSMGPTWSSLGATSVGRWIATDNVSRHVVYLPVSTRTQWRIPAAPTTGAPDALAAPTTSETSALAFGSSFDATFDLTTVKIADPSSTLQLYSRARP